MALLEVEEKTLPQGKIIYIFLNNPNTRNSMTWQMGEEFAALLEKIQSEKPLPRAIILSGRNDVFCAGGDLNLLKSFSQKTFKENQIGMKKFYNFFLSVRKISVPVISAACGHAIGAGLALAVACDLRVFADEGKYSFNFVKLGIHPGMGSSYTTVELIGQSRANKLLFLADTINGRQAEDWGLCDYSVPKKDVLKKAEELALSLAVAAPLAIQELKNNIYSHENLQIALEKESDSQARNFISEDFKETMRSIEDKRKPIFKGL